MNVIKHNMGKILLNMQGGLKPGDCVYVDLNKDGVIDADDVCALGYTNNPEYVAGLNFGFSWKNFEMSMQWTGAFNTSAFVAGNFP